jgi:hypothetical protein
MIVEAREIRRVRGGELRDQGRVRHRAIRALREHRRRTGYSTEGRKTKGYHAKDEGRA